MEGRRKGAQVGLGKISRRTLARVIKAGSLMCLGLSAGKGGETPDKAALLGA